MYYGAKVRDRRVTSSLMSRVEPKGRLLLGSLVVVMHLVILTGWPSPSTKESLRETTNPAIFWLQFPSTSLAQQKARAVSELDTTRDSKLESGSPYEPAPVALPVRPLLEYLRSIDNAPLKIDGGLSASTQSSSFSSNLVDEYSATQGLNEKVSGDNLGIKNAPSALTLTLPKNWADAATERPARKALDDHRSNTPKLTAWDELEMAVGAAPCFLLRPDETGTVRKVVGKRKALPRLYSESTRDSRPVYVCIEQ